MPISKIKTSSILADAASTNLNIDAGTLFLDTTNNRVGVGTTSPSSNLHVTTAGVAAVPATSGTTLSTGTLIRLGTSSDSAGSIGTIGLSTNQMWIQATDSTNLATVYALLLNPNGGNVGIGTASPSTKLEVAGNAKLTGTNLAIVPSTATSAAYLLNTNTGGNFFLGIDSSTGASFTGMAYGRFLYSGGAYPMVFLTNDTERMRINSSGNVGIGTSSPAANNRLTLSDTNPSKLNITGGSNQNGMTFAVTGTSNEYYVAGGVNLLVGGDKGFLIYDVTNARGKFYVEDTTGETRTLATTFLSYYTGASERMRIDSSGNVGIGTSSPSSYGKLTVNDTSHSSVYVRSSSTNFAGLLLDNTNSASKWQIGVEGGTYNTAGVLNIGISGVGPAIAIDTSRNVGIGTSSPAVKLEVYQSTAGIGAGLIRHVNGNAVNVQPSYNYYDAYHHIFRGLSGTTESIRINETGSIVLGYNLATPCLVTKNFATPHAVGNRGADVRFGITDGSFGGLITQNVASSNPAFNAQYIEFHTHQGGVSAGERMRITADGVVKLTLGQIEFPTTQVASSNVNTLDDYEEGSWTPNVNGQATGTFTVTVGTYVKIGKQVTIWFRCDGGNTGTGGATQYVSGLPFNVGTYSEASIVGIMGTNGPATRIQNLMTLTGNRGVLYVYNGGSQEATAISYASGTATYWVD